MPFFFSFERGVPLPLPGLCAGLLLRRRVGVPFFSFSFDARLATPRLNSPSACSALADADSIVVDAICAEAGGASVAAS